MDYSKVGSIVINFLRPEITIQCLESLLLYAKGIKIYCGDQDGDLNLKKFCKNTGINYVKLRKDCGIGVARNKLVDIAIEDGCDYFMWGDNDFIYNEYLNLDQAVIILNKNKKIGVVGGSLIEKDKLVHYERYMYYDKKRRILTFVPIDKCYPKTFHVDPDPIITEHTGSVPEISYQLCDITFNFCVAKAAVWKNKKVRWNNKIKVRFEHSYWFLMLQQYSKFEVAYCQAFQAIHKKTRTKEYDVFRNRDSDSLVYSKALGLDMMFGIGEAPYDFLKLKASDPIKLFQKKLELIENITTEMESDSNISEPAKFLKENHYLNEIHLGAFFTILKENDIKTTILDKGCLSLVLFGTFDVTSLELGLSSEITPNQGQFINDTASKLDIPVITVAWDNNTKIRPWRNLDLNIPLPVIGYLESIFGPEWKKAQVLRGIHG